MMCTLSVVGYRPEFHERGAMVLSHWNLKTSIIINLLLPRIHLRSPNLPWGRGECLQITWGEYATLESSFSPNKIRNRKFQFETKNMLAHAVTIWSILYTQMFLPPRKSFPPFLTSFYFLSFSCSLHHPPLGVPNSDHIFWGRDN